MDKAPGEESEGGDLKGDGKQSKVNFGAGGAETGESVNEPERDKMDKADKKTKKGSEKDLKGKITSIGKVPKTPDDYKTKAGSSKEPITSLSFRSMSALRAAMSRQSRLKMKSSSRKLGKSESQLEREDSDISGDFSWESYYSEISVVKSLEKIESATGKKAKKGAKDKKAKAKKEKPGKESAEPEVPVVLSPSEEMRRMKEEMMAELAREAEAAERAERGIEEEPQKKKPKKEKKLSKKQMLLQAQKEEEARKQAELDAIKYAEEERLRKLEEKRAGIEKEKRETTEMQLRREQLRASRAVIMNIVQHDADVGLQLKKKEEWELYLKCDGLPDASSSPELSMYIHLWEMVIDKMTIKDVDVKSIEVIKLLDTLNDLINDTYGVPAQTLNNWKWVRVVFREHLHESLDVATYQLLRNINANLNRTSKETADFDFQNPNFRLSLWLRVQLPIPMFNPRTPPKPRIDLHFANVNMSVQFPNEIKCEMMAIRAMYLRYDHLSDLSISYWPPKTPEQYDDNLLNVVAIEWREKLKYKYDNRYIPLLLDEEGNPKAKQPVAHMSADIPDDEDIPIVPYLKVEPAASEHVIAVEDVFYAKTRESLPITVEEHVINLRKYNVIGGVYYINLVYQPPQPYEMISYKIIMTTLKIPDKLEEVPFYAEYIPPPEPELDVIRTPEEIEEEMKKQEVLLEELILVTLTLPEHVMFMELPAVCYWNKDKVAWSTECVFDLKHNEEKGCLSFRTSVFGCFALYSYRFSNLPFQAWDIKPESNGTVTLQLTAAILYIEFNITVGMACITQLQNGPNNALQDLIGTYYKLPKLIRLMEAGGVNVFPSLDTFCYVTGTCEKHWPTEKHLYYNMAQLSTAFNFTWSRWNFTAGRRNLVLQMREYKPDRPTNREFAMLQVTPLNALYVDCTEVSQVFNDEGVEGMKFYADLYHLMKGTSNMGLKTRVANAPLLLIKTLAELLKSMRILSYS